MGLKVKSGNWEVWTVAQHLCNPHGSYLSFLPVPLTCPSAFSCPHPSLSCSSPPLAQIIVFSTPPTSEQLQWAASVAIAIECVVWAVALLLVQIFNLSRNFSRCEM